MALSILPKHYIKGHKNYKHEFHNYFSRPSHAYTVLYLTCDNYPKSLTNMIDLSPK